MSFRSVQWLSQLTTGLRVAASGSCHRARSSPVNGRSPLSGSRPASGDSAWARAPHEIPCCWAKTRARRAANVVRQARTRGSRGSGRSYERCSVTVHAWAIAAPETAMRHAAQHWWPESGQRRRYSPRVVAISSRTAQAVLASTVPTSGCLHPALSL